MSTTVEETPQVDILVPPKQAVSYTFGPDGLLTYTQRPLSFFGKIELFSILGSAVDKALKDGGVSVVELLEDVPTDRKSLDQISEADQFVRTIARFVQYAPDFLKDLYCVSLNVPREERDFVKSVMELPAEEGGLTDDQGVQILETFVDQNWAVLLDFFKEKILPLISKLTQSTDQEPQSSKPSKATRRRTPSASKNS